MVRAMLIVLEKLQDEKIIGKDNLMTRLDDRIQNDENDIIYKFLLGEKGPLMITQHIFDENKTQIRVIEDGNDIYKRQTFKWKT